MNLAGVMDPSEIVKRALLVRNLASLRSSLKMSEDQLRDKLTIHFQHRKISHGGDVHEVIYPLNSNKDDAIVLFDDAKDRETAVLHEQVFNMQLLTVKRLPPVFASIKVEIDPLYFSIMPRDAAGEFAARIQKMATVDKADYSKISCSYPAQLQSVEREVLHLVVRHEGTSQESSMLSDGDGFEAAGASNYNPQSAHDWQRSSEEPDGKVKGHEADSEYLSKQTEDPEEFMDAQSVFPKQHTAVGDLKHEPDISGPAEVKKKQTPAKEEEDSNIADMSNASDTGVVVNRNTYRYLKAFEDKVMKDMCKKYKVQLRSTVETVDNVKVHVIASNLKTPADDVVKAKDEFISFYQKAHMEIVRRTVDCSLVSLQNREEAVRKTLRNYKTDTLITKVDGSSHLRLIIRRGDADEVAREFRELAGIRSSRKLRTSAAGDEDSRNGPSPTTKSNSSTRLYAGSNTRDERSSLAMYNTPSDVLQNSRERATDNSFKFVTNEGMNIANMQGDITKQNVHAIVNPTDSSLSNYGGVANAIHAAAGHQLERECKSKTTGHRYFQTLESILTPGFSLNCSIIHVVVPSFMYSSHQTFSWDLHNAFLNCLHTAEYHKISSLAIPLIGSGSIGAPKNICADALIWALLEFSRKSGVPKAVREVFLVNIDENATKAIQQSLEAVFRDDHASGVKATSFSQPTSWDVKRPGLPPQPHPLLSGSQNSTTKVDDSNAVADVSKKDQKGSSGPQDPKTADKTVGPTGTQSDMPGAKMQGSSAEDKADKCPICLSDTIVDEEVLKCRHRFCKGCIEQALKNSYRCPVCQTVCRQPSGNQPKGEMTHSVDKFSHLPGYYGDGVITIRYNIQNGTQTEHHPNPRRSFTGLYRTAYLPDNQEGREVLGLLRKAFDAGLVFTVGRSVTSGQEDTVTWNDIHHKTRMNGGPTHYGYPDPDYLKRVKEDLAAKGIC